MIRQGEHVMDDVQSSAVHILVVEDDPQTAAMLQRALAFEGYQVSVTHNGPAALQSALHSPSDLVILDWMLPGLDGLEVCRRMRQADPDLPILMLTARAEIDDRVHGLR